MNLTDLAFRSGGLDRAAHLRDKAQEQWTETARVLPMWRGRPLVAGAAGPDGDRHLYFVSPSHPILAERTPTPLLLGAQDGTPIFAADISAWTPRITAPDGTPGAPGDPIPAPEGMDLPQDAEFPDMRGMLLDLTAFEGEVAATAKGILEWHRSHGYCAACGSKTAMSQAGWRRDCADCGRQHFPRTDPVVIMLVTHGNSLLLGRSPGWPEGMYSLLAGFMEPGETIGAAVAREVAEETGVKVGETRMLISQPWPFPASLMIGCTAEATSTEITLDPAELEDAVWLTREELLSVFEGTHPKLRQPRGGAIAQVLMKNWLAGTLDLPQTSGQ